MPSCSRTFFLSLLLPLPAVGASAQKPETLTADSIMARVAAHQDQAEAERAHFVYVQHAKVQSRKGSTVQCEEITDYRVVPTEKGQQLTLLTLSGHVLNGKTNVHYTALPKKESIPNDRDKKQDGGERSVVHDADHDDTAIPLNDIDIDLVESMRKEFTGDQKSKDGVSASLFPLTSKEQGNMVFVLKGREPKNGRATFHIVFQPKDKDDYGWKGDAWIDETEFQPVVVRTALSRSMPFAVKALLGTNVPGLGMTAIYAPQEGGVWFPASFGTEFKIKVLFFFSRQIVVGVENRNFERTHVKSTLQSVEGQP